MTDIHIINEHSFRHWGKFDIIYNNKTYTALWWKKEKRLDTNAPEDVYKRVYNALFDENSKGCPIG